MSPSVKRPKNDGQLQKVRAMQLDAPTLQAVQTLKVTLNAYGAALKKHAYLSTGVEPATDLERGNAKRVLTTAQQKLKQARADLDSILWEDNDT